MTFTDPAAHSHKLPGPQLRAERNPLVNPSGAWDPHRAEEDVFRSTDENKWRPQPNSSRDRIRNEAPATIPGLTARQGLGHQKLAELQDHYNLGTGMFRRYRTKDERSEADVRAADALYAKQVGIIQKQYDLNREAERTTQGPTKTFFRALWRLAFGDAEFRWFY